MDRLADTKARCKHRCTDAAMEYFKSVVMVLCYEAGLHQIDAVAVPRKTRGRYDTAKRQLAELNAPNPLPKRKTAAAEIQSLVSQKNECSNEYREKSDRLHELMTVQRNYQPAMQQPKRGRSHEQER